MGCYNCGSDRGSAARLCPECVERGKSNPQARAEMIRRGIGSSSSGQVSRLERLRIPLLMMLLSAVLGIVVFSGGSFGFFGAAGGPPPAPEEVRATVEQYLIAQKKRNCAGTVTLDSLTISRVGEFDSGGQLSINAFPVYGDFAVTCREGRSRMTWNGRDDGRTVIVWVRKSTFGAGYDSYVPSFFAPALGG